MVRVAFLHPNMGIGGAEQLVVNLAMSFKKLGWYVKIFTPAYDPNRALEQVKNGTIDIEVKGSFFPKKIFGKFHAFCEYVRLTIAAIYLILFEKNFDLVVIDQIPLPLPLLNLRFKTFFYCHYPDKLLCTERKSLLKKIYRFFLDLVEEITMCFAHEIAVNSNYTLGIYRNNFKLLSKFRRHLPQIIYPCIDPDDYEKKNFEKNQLINIQGLEEGLKGKDLNKIKVMASLNRYEKKKNVVLALKAYLNFMGKISSFVKKSLSNLENEDFSTNKILENLKEEIDNHILIIAGGYDNQVIECREVLEELENLAIKSDFKNNIFILKNISGEERAILLNTANVMLYTPKNEHFGIVPVEGMLSGAMVMCHKSGGPLESVNDNVTGYLIDSEDEEKWADKLVEYFGNQKNFDKENGMNKLVIKERLKNHILEKFSLDAMMRDVYNMWNNKLEKKLPEEVNNKKEE